MGFLNWLFGRKEKPRPTSLPRYYPPTPKPSTRDDDGISDLLNPANPASPLYHAAQDDSAHQHTAHSDSSRHHTDSTPTHHHDPSPTHHHDSTPTHHGAHDHNATTQPSFDQSSHSHGAADAGGSFDSGGHHSH